MRVVLVGDGATGKTRLLQAIVKEKQQSDFENIYEFKHLNGKSLTLVDTVGQDELSRIRLSSYPSTDVFVLCFSLISPYSFDNITSKWLPEISQYAEGKNIILVGTKSDLRDDEHALERLKSLGKLPISFQQGKKLKKEIGAIDYIECSSLSEDGINNLIEVILSCFNEKGERKSKSSKKEKKCVIL